LLQALLFPLALAVRENADLGKRRATEIHLNAAQKFLSEVNGLCARNVDHGVCVTKLHAIEGCKHLEGLFVAGKKQTCFGFSKLEYV